MKRANKTLRSNICKYLLIPIIVIVDIIMLIVITPLTDGKTYSDHKGVYTYDELFSSKTEGADMKDIISAIALSDNGFVEVKASEFLSDVKFQSVDEIKATAIMVFYNPQNEICAINTLGAFGSLLDKFSVSDEDVYSISNVTGYVVRGTLFWFEDEIYMFANLKDDSYIFDEEFSMRENAIRSTVYLCNDTISLFKLCDINETFVKEKISGHTFLESHIKTYPNWYGNLQKITKYRVVALLMFFVQFPIVFCIYNKVVPKKSENKKNKNK